MFVNIQLPQNGFLISVVYLKTVPLVFLNILIIHISYIHY